MENRKLRFSSYVLGTPFPHDLRIKDRRTIYKGSGHVIRMVFRQDRVEFVVVKSSLVIEGRMARYLSTGIGKLLKGKEEGVDPVRPKPEVSTGVKVSITGPLFHGGPKESRSFVTVSTGKGQGKVQLHDRYIPSKRSTDRVTASK